MSDSEPRIQESPQPGERSSRRWSLRSNDLAWRLVGAYGFVYHRGSGSTYAMPRLSTEILARISERTSVTERELLKAVAEDDGGLVEAGTQPGSREDLLGWALQPLMDARLIRECT
ncbi:HPr-rel-A system PqqD family peptide chaperone [Halorhodospira halophila]|uniref:Uncharacterized protein n=1 Tax=Halorhodospira halophila (strain DSM 244 / SL1) TaxID=349124 RepID=A1WX96_HALHL|nr:HPr-rel-A system PqqD family peptide chaperone [Halorhodospira halophila]ABM62308.1 hypothetical protein Hhal_1541 [Halorhodospira halophila SL1]MBK1729283.1 HPr-rel-A system PqqD family peptide chaperone [Halorhodospira halophila]